MSFAEGHSTACGWDSMNEDKAMKIHDSIQWSFFMKPEDAPEMSCLIRALRITPAT